MKETPTKSENDTFVYVQDLLERALDAREGYQKAAELTNSPGLRQFFTENSGQRATFAQELEALLRKAGVEPDYSGTLTAKIHQGWMSLVSKVSSGEEGLLSECYRGEEKALADYEDALDSMDLPINVAGVIERQRDRLKGELFTLNELKEVEKAAA